MTEMTIWAPVGMGELEGQREKYRGRSSQQELQARAEAGSFKHNSLVEFQKYPPCAQMGTQFHM